MQYFKKIRLKLFVGIMIIGVFPLFLNFLVYLFHYKKIVTVQSVTKFLLNNNLFYETIATFFIALIVAVHCTSPFKKLEKIREHLQGKNFTKKIKGEGEDIVGRLIKTINIVLEQLKASQEMLGSRSKKIVESEKKHRELLNLFTDATFELDENERIINIKHAEIIFGYTDQELLGRKSFELVHPDDHERLTKELRKMTPKSNKPIRDLKIRILAQAGGVRYCLANCRTIFENGKLIRREGVLRDITPRELLAQKVALEKDKLEKMYNNLHDSYLALGKVNAQIAALTEINTTFSSNLDWKDKLYYIIESIRSFMQGDETLLFVQESNGQKFKLKHASVDFDFWEDIRLSKRNKVVKDTIKNRNIVKYSEESNLLDKERASAKKFKAMIAIPVIINNEVIGIFVVFFQDSEKLEKFPTKLALAYTSQMSIALMMSGELDHSLKKIF